MVWREICCHILELRGGWFSQDRLVLDGLAGVLWSVCGRDLGWLSLVAGVALGQSQRLARRSVPKVARGHGRAPPRHSGGALQAGFSGQKSRRGATSLPRR